VITFQQLYHDPQWWKAADKMRGWSECLFRHSLAVADLALEIGRELDLPDDECRILQTAGLLHDLGKTMWPKLLVDKHSLNDADWGIVKAHPATGAKLAEAWGHSRDETVLRLIREHHACGINGYPKESGDPHPLSRIVNAAEVYAALTEPRPYRPLPLLPRDALRLLSNDGHGPEVLAALGRARRIQAAEPPPESSSG
jgi:putative nucleotidyltransferase with HDIG domain